MVRPGIERGDKSVHHIVAIDRRDALGSGPRDHDLMAIVGKERADDLSRVVAGAEDVGAAEDDQVPAGPMEQRLRRRFRAEVVGRRIWIRTDVAEKHDALHGRSGEGVYHALGRVEDCLIPRVAVARSNTVVEVDDGGCIPTGSGKALVRCDGSDLARERREAP